MSDTVADAITDLCSRVGVDARLVTVISDEDVTWPDASLGCPEPGLMYAQVLTEGKRIVLEVGGRRYKYHSGAGGPFLCEGPAR